jgi:uncharacterized surface protein with fasciclin (FAS1) repeats
MRQKRTSSTRRWRPASSRHWLLPSVRQAWSTRSRGRAVYSLRPTDDAFATLPAGTVENLLKPENKDELTAILTDHVVPGRVMAAEVVKLNEAKTLNGKMLKVTVKGSTVMINDAKVTATDVVASNEVIHVIDSVLLPPTR